MRRGAILALALSLAALWAPGAASAAPEPFTRFCLQGSGAGQCLLPRGLSTSPIDGHIYVGDQLNRRIDEFTAWGEFIRSWGWGVDDGSSELQTCTGASGCQAGILGSGVGQFSQATGLAVDSAGDVYVVDFGNVRIEKFDSEGDFLLMFGGGVDQGPNHPGNLCTAQFIAEGDTCGAGSSGTGNGQFSSEWGIGNTIAIGTGDQLYVGDKGRIQEFDSGGHFVRVLPDPGELLSSGKPPVGSLAVDPGTGDLYMAYPNGVSEIEKTLPNVYRLDASSGSVLDTLEVAKPSALTVDAAGDVYVFDQRLIVNGNPSDPGSHGSRILRFDSAGNLLETFGQTPLFAKDEIRNSVGLATSSVCFAGSAEGFYLASFNASDHAYDFVQAYGPTPDPEKCPPPQVPPSLDAQFAAAVDTDSALLKAKINPHYFTAGVGTTTYYVQWATEACIEAEGWEGACVQEQPAPPGEEIVSLPVNEDVTVALELSGLAPNTAYRYRFVTEGSGEPGEPIIGVGGKPGIEGADAGFATLFTTPIPGCPNDAFRAGSGARLPDCRAYELVSPLDKAGGDVQARLNIVPFEARMDEASTAGDEITFSAYRAFQDPQSAPFSSQYLTKRAAEEGWQTEAISPPQEGESVPSPLNAIDNLFRAFTPDLSQAFVQTYTEPLLAPGAIADEANVYRRDSASGAYAACTTAPPLSNQAKTHGPQVQGYSAAGDLVAFREEGKLTADGSDELKSGGRPVNQAYVCAFEGGTATVRLVSVLPSGEASDLENTIGGPANEFFQVDQGRTESLEHAVSADGSKVFWTASTFTDNVEPGALYVRLNPGAEPTASGECDETEPNKACTVLIDAGPARFLTAAKDGSVAIFIDSSGEMNEFEVANGETRSIAGEVVGYLGASDDASRIYFLSKEAIEGGGEAGQPNLYLYERGVGTSFIATLSSQDSAQGNTVPSPGNYEPAWHTARVTPDGSTVAFMSNDPDLAEEVAGYDNTDQAGNSPAAEIYRFAMGESLTCISCNRTGQRPAGRQIQRTGALLYGASMLPTWLNSLYAPRVLSDSGSRIFFEAFEPLTPADTNEKADVYQWEALGEGGCEEEDSAFDPQSQGCISLISSGEGEFDSQFVDASPSGNDVFIRTASSLVAWDPGATDIYDARVEGGLPEPPPPLQGDPCEGEECQPPPKPAPQSIQPATGNPVPGNVHEAQKPKHCRKGTHKVKKHGKVRCVKNKKHKHRHQRPADQRAKG
jgi:DNA-binding beta-propeller fold protein YncE